jgi:starch synthase
MSKPIGVLFVATEAEPFIKTGSLASIAGNLPRTVKSLGHDIRVMLPGYSFINDRRFQIHNLLRMQDIKIPVAGKMEQANIKSSYLNGDSHKVQVYFLSNERYFSREGLYYHPETKKYFADNDERFIFFCRGVLETLKRLQWQPQIIHCNDWQCGLIPMYLKTLYKDDINLRNIRTVFTAYSLASYGTFPKSSIDKTGLPNELFQNGNDRIGKLNFLQAGLAYADVVTTMGVKANNGICRTPLDEFDNISQTRKNDIVSMRNESHNGYCYDTVVQKFLDVYRDLAKITR